MTHPADPRPPAVALPALVLLLLLLSAGFALVVWPYFGAVFWAAVLALLFTPLYRRLLARLRGRRVPAALATLGVVLLIVILPLTLVVTSLTGEVVALVARMKSGELDLVHQFQRALSALPSWLTGLLDRLGVGDWALLQARLREALTQRGQAIAGRAVGYGQDALDIVVAFFVSMYVLFFLLLDGPRVVQHVERAIPLPRAETRRLLRQLAAVIRATVKGNVLVAVVQGALGGLAFWALGVHAPVLWAAVMAFLSLLPAVGAALVWLPVALYLLATGQLWQGLGLIAFGTLVIGLVDNVLRPILVGKEIQLPDYAVLVATIGGLAVFGINGFVIGPVIVEMFVVTWELFADRHRRDGGAASG